MESDNPWHVDSIQTFWFLKCPECNFDSKKEEIFQDHAIENHPKSWELFSKTLNVYKNVVESEILTQIKTEESEEHILIEENINGNFVNENEDFDDIFTSSGEHPESMKNCDKITSLENSKSNCEEEFRRKEKISAIKSDEEIQNNQDLSELATKSIDHSAFDNLRTNKRGEKLYPCGHCDKKFTSSKDAKRHEKTHTGEKPISCAYCEKKFARSDNLKRHEKLHTGEKTFSCNYCNEKFTQLDQLWAHKRIHVSVGLYECEVCDYTCSNKSNFKRHVSLVHEGKKPFKKRKKITFKCEACDSSFSEKSGLKKHIESVHERKGPFDCSFCGLKFTQTCDLYTHIKGFHEKKKPFVCYECDKNFLLKNTLKRHIESVHKRKKPESSKKLYFTSS